MRMIKSLMSFKDRRTLQWVSFKRREESPLRTIIRALDHSNGNSSWAVSSLNPTSSTTSPTPECSWTTCKTWCLKWTAPVSQKPGTPEPSICSVGWSSIQPYPWPSKSQRTSLENRSEPLMIMTRMSTGSTRKISKFMISHIRAPSIVSWWATHAQWLFKTRILSESTRSSDVSSSWTAWSPRAWRLL